MKVRNSDNPERRCPPALQDEAEYWKRPVARFEIFVGGRYWNVSPSGPNRRGRRMLKPDKRKKPR